MAEYLPPTENLPIFDSESFKDSNNEFLTYDKANKYFLKFPNAQGTENFNELSANEITAPGDLLLNPVGSVDMNGKVLNMTNGEIHNCPLIHSRNNQDIVIEGKGTGKVTFKAVTNIMELSSGSVVVKRPILMNDDTSANRVVNSSTLQLNETTSVYNPTVLHQIYQTGGTANYINLVNNGSTNFSVVNNVGSLFTPLTITTTSNNIPSNINLAMAAGTGIINQAISNTGNSLSNIFKKSTIAINSGFSTGSSTSGLEIYDESGGGRGLFILPNSGGGSFSNLNMSNDCALISRSPQNNNSISITNWNTELRNGIRIFTTDINNCGLTIQCGNGIGSIFSELRMAFNKTLNTLTTSFNNPIDFNPTNLGAISPARRLLSGLGTLSFTDILGNTTGGTTNSTIIMDSLATYPGLNFDCSLNNGNHAFSVNSSIGVKSMPFFISSAITSVLNTFSVRSSVTPSNRLDIITDASNNTNIRSRSSTANTNALINLNCDFVSVGGLVTNNPVATLSPFFFEVKRPIQFNYSTFPTSNTQLGFVSSGSLTTRTTSTQAVPSNVGSVTLGIGTWNIIANFSFSNSGARTYTVLSYGIGTIADDFTTISPYVVSYIREPNFVITSVTISRQVSLTLQLIESTLIYFNERVVFSDGGGNSTLGGTYNITRIG
jgi:hypothetical protein